MISTRRVTTVVLATTLGAQATVLVLAFIDPLVHHLGWLNNLMLALPLLVAVSVAVSQAQATGGTFARVVFTCEVIIVSCAMSFYHIASATI